MILNKILNNDYSLNLVNKFYTILVGLFSSALLTRYLGVTYRGDYSYIIQFTTVSAIILNVGINQSYSYFYRTNKGDVLDRFINIYVFQFILNLVLAIFLSTLLGESIYTYAIILIPFALFLQQMESSVAVEDIRLKIKLHMFNVTIKFFAFMFMYFFLNEGLWAPIIFTILINSTTVAIYIYRLGIKLTIPKVNFKFLKKVIEYSWLPMITSLLTMLNYSLDIFMLRHLGNSVELGLYAVAVGIINYFWLIPDSFKEVLVSRTARKSSIYSTVLAIKISTIAVVFAIFMFLVFGKPVLYILYGAEFLDSYLVTMILSLGSISMIYFKIIGVILLAEGKRWVFFFSLLTSVTLNLVMNLISIPLYGMYGAAISSVITYTLSGLLFLIYYLKTNQLEFKSVLVFTKSEIKDLKTIFKRS